MPRRTKIVATIGPASDSPDVLRRLIEVGADVIRIGLAHGTLDDAMARYRTVRAVSEELGRHIGVLIDLPGPKVRLGSFGDSPTILDTGAPLTLIPGRDTSDTSVLGVDYQNLLKDIHPGDHLPVGDGSVVIQVESVDGDAAKATVLYGGPVQGRPGLHISSDRLSLSTPTPTDLHLLDAFVDAGVDMVALSFVRSAHDIRRIGTEPHPRGPLVVAKIETRAAVENLQGIIEASGAIMIARGDLGTELGIEELPHLQKQITRDCISGGKPVITATQMFESMITSPTPTRAEVSDVANAIFDGTSAVMLSAESAVGIDPVNAVATMSRVAERADQEFDYDAWARRIRHLRRSAVGNSSEDKLTDARTAAAWRAATEMGVAAIICISDSGLTVRSTARVRPAMPLIGFSPDDRTLRQLSLSWGTTTLRAPRHVDTIALMDDLIVQARDAGLVRPGQTVAVLAGAGSRSRSTDVLHLARVP